MKLKLLKDLPDFPAGTVLETDKPSWSKGDPYIPDWLDYLLKSYIKYSEYPDWFERIDETPLYWEPERGEQVFFVNEEGYVKTSFYTPDLPHLYHKCLTGELYRTEEAAEKAKQYKKALTRVRKWISENNIQVVERQGYQVDAWIVAYDHSKDGFEVLTDEPNVQMTVLLPVFAYRPDAKNFIHNCHDDLKTIFGVES